MQEQDIDNTEQIYANGQKTSTLKDYHTEPFRCKSVMYTTTYLNTLVCL